MGYGDSLPGSFVYVVADERGWHKIGVSADIKLRLYHLSRDIGFRPVVGVRVFQAAMASASVVQGPTYAVQPHPTPQRATRSPS